MMTHDKQPNFLLICNSDIAEHFKLGSVLTNRFINLGGDEGRSSIGQLGDVQPTDTSSLLYAAKIIPELCRKLNVYYQLIHYLHDTENLILYLLSTCVYISLLD